MDLHRLSNTTSKDAKSKGCDADPAHDFGIVHQTPSNLDQGIGGWMTDALPDTPSADRQPVDVPLNLMKMALALLDREDRGGSVAACLLQEAIEARSTQ
jgi:hypothetical protein